MNKKELLDELIKLEIERDRYVRAYTVFANLDVLRQYEVKINDLRSRLLDEIGSEQKERYCE